MNSQSNIKPRQIELKCIDGRYHNYYLRKNIKQNIIENDITLYEYDEVILKIINRPNIEENILKNFDTYFKFAENEEQNKYIQENSSKRIHQLNQGELVNVEITSESCAMLLTDLMLEMEMLKKEINALKNGGVK